MPELTREQIIELAANATIETQRLATERGNRQRGDPYPINIQRINPSPGVRARLEGRSLTNDEKRIWKEIGYDPETGWTLVAQARQNRKKFQPYSTPAWTQGKPKTLTRSVSRRRRKTRRSRR